MNGLLRRLIKGSCLTERQFYAFLIKRGLPSWLDAQDLEAIQDLKGRPSGEVSTIRAQARRNLRAALYTLILLRAVGALDEEALGAVFRAGAEVNRLLLAGLEVPDEALSAVAEAVEEIVGSALL